ncbi:MAG: hypothetical protein IT378_07645 [Sandaracinaceae bacterium]|nr:hypothetical protein [Sandaracinaceae bacterium]
MNDRRALSVPFSLLLSLGLAPALAGRAAAQDTVSQDTVSQDPVSQDPVSRDPVSGVPDELADELDDRPRDATPSSERAAPSRLSEPAASEPGAPREPETGEARARVPSPLLAVMEVAISMTPNLRLTTAGIGGLAGLAGLGVGASTDFTYAVDPSVFVGVGLSVGYAQQPGAAVLESTRVEVPVICQLYLETPVRGALVPTLRVVPAFRWQSQTLASAGGTQASAGARLDVGIGITWLFLDRLALRVLGVIGGGADIRYEGATATTFQMSVSADIGLVVRL